jgi:hypothetical protein
MQVIAAYRQLYEGQELPNTRALRRHLIEGILPGLALYKVLRKAGESKEGALAIIDGIFGALFAEKAAKMRRLGRLKLIYFFLRLCIRTAMRAFPNEGWRIEWVHNDRNAIRFNMRDRL